MSKKASELCNKCGNSPKYPSQGLCKECFFEKIQRQHLQKRKCRNNIVTDLEGEVWAEIVGADGYLISNMGRVKSINYRCRRTDASTQNEVVLKLRPARVGGYLKVDLDKYNWRPSVHRLVATYFVDNKSNKPLVLHKDNNKQNNKAANLYWGDRSENAKDYAAHLGASNGMRKKLSKESVLDIYSSGNSVQSLAIKHNINSSTVWMIKTGYRWSSITGHTCTDKRKLNEKN
jgi:hypothetical protein